MHETASSHPCAPVSQVHAIFEPKQDSTAKDLVLVEDEDAEVRLGKLAAMLGLTRVGLIIGHPARECRGMSTGRTLLRPALDSRAAPWAHGFPPRHMSRHVFTTQLRLLRQRAAARLAHARPGRASAPAPAASAPAKARPLIVLCLARSQADAENGGRFIMMKARLVPPTPAPASPFYTCCTRFPLRVHAPPLAELLQRFMLSTRRDPCSIARRISTVWPPWKRTRLPPSVGKVCVRSFRLAAAGTN